jgi:glyoxylase-like metal-dependent hydrolase (beta-lactamase superfamily II)
MSWLSQGDAGGGRQNNILLNIISKAKKISARLRSMTPSVQPFFEPVTCSVSYVVYDREGGACAVIDSVLDYEASSGRTGTRSAQRIVDFVRSRRLRVEWLLETHAHADHLSAAHYLRGLLGGKIAIGAEIARVQAAFQGIFNLEPGFRADGSQFDHLLKDGESFAIGSVTVQALSVPGHTPACMAFLIGNAVFVGDTLFMPDVGTARCDFPGGDAVALYRSIRRLLALPPSTRLFMCHDYPPPGREPAWEATVSAQRERNIHVHQGVTEKQFVAMRTARDKTLGMPALMLPAVQVNIRAGALPPVEPNGVAYLKIPLNLL